MKVAFYPARLNKVVDFSNSPNIQDGKVYKFGYQPKFGDSTVNPYPQFNDKLDNETEERLSFTSSNFQKNKSGANQPLSKFVKTSDSPINTTPRKDKQKEENKNGNQLGNMANLDEQDDDYKNNFK